LSCAVDNVEAATFGGKRRRRFYLLPVNLTILESPWELESPWPSGTGPGWGPPLRAWRIFDRIPPEI